MKMRDAMGIRKRQATNEAINSLSTAIYAALCIVATWQGLLYIEQ